jgi:hypothetical protein
MQNCSGGFAGKHYFDLMMSDPSAYQVVDGRIP